MRAPYSTGPKMEASQFLDFDMDGISVPMAASQTALMLPGGRIRLGNGLGDA